MLGVARLVLLGHRDSGMAGWDANAHPYALAAAPVDRVAGRLAALCAAGGCRGAACTTTRAASTATPTTSPCTGSARPRRARAGITGYEATVAADRPRARRPHLVDRAAGAAVGWDAGGITTVVTADAG